MEKIVTQNKVFYQFNSMKPKEVFHFTSTKKGWGGDGKSRFTGDVEEAYLPFRRELAKAFDLNPEQLFFPRQTHSNHVEIIRKPANELAIPDTDALITNQPGICICVQTADCVPILLHDPVKNVVAAIHAGWRGTVEKIVCKTLKIMQTEFDSNPVDVWAGIGPSISQQYYEVGEDVIYRVNKQFEDALKLLKPSENKKAYFDLWKANQHLLVQSGVSYNQIDILGLCTYFEESSFFSARRDGADTGRMVSGIMLF